jgi:hypothetical protein
MSTITVNELRQIVPALVLSCPLNQEDAVFTDLLSNVSLVAKRGEVCVRHSDESYNTVYFLEVIIIYHTPNNIIVSICGLHGAHSSLTLHKKSQHSSWPVLLNI